MSDPKRFDRRSLFDAVRRVLQSDEPGPNRSAPAESHPMPARRAGFSLNGFYEHRAATDSEQPQPFPRFTLREGIVPVETTSVGTGPKMPPKGGTP